MAKKVNRQLIVFGSFAAFFLYGLIENVRGPIMPSFLTEFAFTYSDGGMVFAGLYFGCFISFIFFGIFGGKMGNRNLVIIGSFFIAAGSFGFYSSSLLILLFASMVVAGLGLGSLEIGVSAWLSALFSAENKAAKYLLLAGFFHGLGSMAGAYFAGKAIEYMVPWQKIYLIIGIIAFALGLYLLFIRSEEKEGVKENPSLEMIRSVFFQKEMWFFYLIIFGYVGVQTGISTWMTEYLNKYHAFSIEKATVYTTLFFLFLMSGRFLGSFVVDRIGHQKSMHYSTLITCALICLSSFGGGLFSFCLPLTGLFVSIIFPTTAAMMSRISEDHLVLRFGFLFIFAGLGGIFGPWGIGTLSDLAGIHTGISLGLLLLTLLMLFPFWFQKYFLQDTGKLSKPLQQE